MKSVLAAIALLVATLHSLPAQSIAGEWRGTMNTPGAEVPLNFVLNVKGDTLTGTVKRTTGDVQLKGRAKGDSVFIDYTILYNESPFPLSLRGRVVRDTLNGIVDFGGGNEDSFTTTRVATKPDSTKAAPPKAGGGGAGG